MPPVNCGKITKFLRNNALTLFIILGVIGGGVLGAILRASRDEKWTKREIMYIQFLGDLFLQMLKSLIIPLMVASVVSAIGSLDLRMSGKMGVRSVVYYATTTILAVIEGIILVLAIHPGQKSDHKPQQEKPKTTTTQDTLMDLIRNMFPPNLVQACIAQYRTVLKPNDTTPILEWEISSEYSGGTNVLGLVMFSIILGIALAKMIKEGDPLLNFFNCLSQCMMFITGWVILVSPIGILFLVTGKMLEMEDFAVFGGQLGMYFMTVLLGLFIHGAIVLPGIYILMTRQLPFKYIANFMSPLATAFGTASSSATLPVAMSALEKLNDIDPRVCRFVMPIGATINMDGTALYEAVAAIFIAQVRGISLSIGQIIAISIAATAASIGAAGIPQAGLVTMVMVLDTVGLPAEDISIILAVDWLLDRFRTTINVLGDAIGAGVIQHLSKNELESQEAPPGMINDTNLSVEAR